MVDAKSRVEDVDMMADDDAGGWMMAAKREPRR